MFVKLHLFSESSSVGYSFLILLFLLYGAGFSILYQPHPLWEVKIAKSAELLGMLSKYKLFILPGILSASLYLLKFHSLFSYRRRWYLSAHAYDC